jgi:hypothetical protein
MHPADPDFADAAWFKSSFSGGNNGECVEVAFVPGGVGVRDSKRHGRGPVLLFGRGEWAAFLAAARAGEFDQAP